MARPDALGAVEQRVDKRKTDAVGFSTGGDVAARARQVFGDLGIYRFP